MSDPDPNLSPREFTRDWFSENEAPWLRILSSFPVGRYLEVGSFEGRSLLWILDHCDHLTEATCIDTWKGSAEHQEYDMDAVWDRFDKNVRQHPKSELVRALKTSSLAGLMRLLAEGKSDHYDLVYIDGSHVAKDVITDLALASHLVAPGGLLIIDDYLWGAPNGVGFLDRPKIAIDAFTSIWFREFMPIPHSPLMQVYLVKVGKPRNYDDHSGRTAANTQGRILNVAHKLMADDIQSLQEYAREASDTCADEPHFKLATDASDPLQPPAVRSE